ncbi:hypothetical protein FOL47_007867 [Perkinsus chesapeaki]|uniref:Bromo domain-containing protein n=1 Tax=Perkinsus chesapeaki TaxID=330153 RepID=A0A7J6LHW6_PERCH|nr:hypothetical protein FOL47_007867 [Perkinsus chesapeaki]
MSPATRRMSARLSNTRRTPQSSSPVNLSPAVGHGGFGRRRVPADKRAASPSGHGNGPRRKSQRLAASAEHVDDEDIEDDGNKSSFSESSNSSSSPSSPDRNDDANSTNPIDQRARRLERRRAGIPASVPETKSGDTEWQQSRYPKRERVETDRFEPEPVHPRHIRRMSNRNSEVDTRRSQHRSSRRSHRRRGGSRHSRSRRRWFRPSANDGEDDVCYTSDSSEEYGDGKRHRRRPDGTRSQIETTFLLKQPEQLIADMSGPLDTRIGEPAASIGNNKGLSFLNECIDCSQLEGWDAIGGETVRKHIHHVVESVLLPLVYPELFKGLGVSPPRGLLLHGPPGTGKTLMARCLAGSCHRLGGGAKVSFFMRKGADVLSKWVGEGERLLRELFDKAKKAQPSIIFFDEIDGLAPVRIGCSGGNSSDPVASGGSSHSSSLVATLLALMDGLDGRGEHVVVLAATNRPDAVDPALRRPGRFDKELRFSPPRGAADRRAILDVHTRKWRSDQMPPGTASWICDPARTAGFTGADIKALTEEAVMMAVRRTYPQIYEEVIKQTSGDANENARGRRTDASQKFIVSASDVTVTPLDFAAALTKIIPSTRRRAQHAAAANGANLAVATPHTSNLFTGQISFAVLAILRALGQDSVQDDMSEEDHVTSSPRKVVTRAISPCTGLILHTSDPLSVLQYVLPGVRLALQERGVAMFIIDMSTISSGQQAVMEIVDTVLQTTPSLLIIYEDVKCMQDRIRLGECEGATSSMIEACTCLSSSLSSRIALHGSGVLTVVLSGESEEAEASPWMSEFEAIDVCMDLSKDYLSSWLCNLLVEQIEENIRLTQRDEHSRQCAQIELPRTGYKYEQPTNDRSLERWAGVSKKDMDKMKTEEDHWFRILRIQIREILKSLGEFSGYRRWFYYPVKLEEYPDYNMIHKNDAEEYTAVSEVVADFELIANNAKKYNSEGSQIYTLAKEFIDRATLKCQCVDDNVVAMCKLMQSRRESREAWLVQQNTGERRSSRLHPSDGVLFDTAATTSPMDIDETDKAVAIALPEPPVPFTASEALREGLQQLSYDLVEEVPRTRYASLWKGVIPMAGRLIATLSKGELPRSSDDELLDHVKEALESCFSDLGRMSLSPVRG